MTETWETAVLPAACRHDARVVLRIGIDLDLLAAGSLLVACIPMFVRVMGRRSNQAAVARR